MKQYDVIIIGSGPCGLMACKTIRHKSVLLIDANSQIGGKISLSGGGRCNITNNKDINSFLENIPKNNKFLFSTFNNFSPTDLIHFFNSNGLKLKEEDNNRMFPASNNSQSVIDFFEQHIQSSPHKHILLNYLVTAIIKNNDEYIIDNTYKSKHLVLALGGASYPHISQGEQSYKLPQMLNHTITSLNPCETPLVVTSPLIQSRTLQGLTLNNVQGDLYVNNKKKISLTKDILITHFGLSGPMALNFSFYIKEALNKNKSSLIDLYIPNPPKRLFEYLDENNHIKFDVSDVKGFKTAFVTNGGVNLKEINPKTLESKLNSNLFIGGELLDINCFTGGYNIGTYLCQGKLIGDVINGK